MIEKHFIGQLEKFYPQYLRNVALSIPFEPLKLRGGKNRPESVVELYNATDAYLKHEKKEGQHGWKVEWETWQSKKLGIQQWPSAVWVDTEEDYLFLLGKRKESQIFKELVFQLIKWNNKIIEWLAKRPLKVLELKSYWPDICSVVDYLLNSDVKDHYIRSLPLPVHTKFLQQHETTILSLLKHFNPELFPESLKTLELALGLKTKPLLFTMRWLDLNLAAKYTSDIEVLSLPVNNLKSSKWEIEEVWMVENETNLYLLPHRKKAIVVFSKGYALQDISNIDLFYKAHLYYWGDLDEDGFIMLHKVRQHYPHVQSVFMDEATVQFHKSTIQKVPFRAKFKTLQLLNNEASAYELLMNCGGRIEQEQLQQQYIQDQLLLISH